MKKAFKKSLLVIEFRNQFLSMERFRTSFEKLDEVFLELSNFYKKSNYTKMVAAWLSGYIEELSQLHDTKLAELITTFKQSLHPRRRELIGMEVDRQFERVQSEVEDELIEVAETLMCHSMTASSQKICLGVVEEYIGKVFQMNRLIVEDNEVGRLGALRGAGESDVGGRARRSGGRGIGEPGKGIERVKKVVKVVRVKEPSVGIRQLKSRIRAMDSIGESPVKSTISRLGDLGLVKSQGPKIKAKIQNFTIEDLGNNYVVSVLESGFGGGNLLMVVQNLSKELQTSSNRPKKLYKIFKFSFNFNFLK